MATAPIESKFEVFRWNGDRNSKIYKDIDYAHLSSIYPNLINFDTLDPARKQVSKAAKGHLIGENGSLMRVFEDRAVIRDFDGEYAQWELHTEDADIRAFFTGHGEPEGVKSGIGGTDFEIHLDTDNLEPKCKFVFENFRDFEMIVVEGPTPKGGTWSYQCQLLTDGIDYIELDEIEIGTRIIQTGAPMGEAAVDRPSPTISAGNAFVKLEVPLTRMGWSMKVTDKAWKNAQDFRLRAVDPTIKQAIEDNFGTPRDLLINTLDEKFFRATNKQIDMHLTYGRSANRFASQFLDGLTQRHLPSGPGLYEFLDSVSSDEYSVKNGSFDIFRNFFKKVWLNKVDYQERVVDVFTGSAGLELVQKWGKAEDLDAVYQTEETNYKMEEGYFKDRKGVITGRKQYVGFYMEPFGLVRFHLLPFLDSTAVETRRYEGYPLSSYQFIVFDFGYGDLRENANIQILKDPTYEQFYVGTGGWSPYGGIGNNQKAKDEFVATLGSENAYELIRETSMAFVMKDTTAAMFLQPGLY